jgi:hypothetical protein
MGQAIGIDRYRDVTPHRLVVSGEQLLQLRERLEDYIIQVEDRFKLVEARYILQLVNRAIQNGEQYMAVSKNTYPIEYVLLSGFTGPCTPVLERTQNES